MDFDIKYNSWYYRNWKAVEKHEITPFALSDFYSDLKTILKPAKRKNKNPEIPINTKTEELCCGANAVFDLLEVVFKTIDEIIETKKFN